MSKPRAQQAKRNVAVPSQRKAPAIKVMGRYYDRVWQRWMLITDAGPIAAALRPDLASHVPPALRIEH